MKGQAMKRTILAAAFLVHLGSVSWSADFKKGYDAYVSGDYATALREFKPLAEQGNAAAQSSLGGMYANGRKVQARLKYPQNTVWSRVESRKVSSIKGLDDLVY
jgi:TPR repeat protein